MRQEYRLIHPADRRQDADLEGRKQNEATLNLGCIAEIHCAYNLSCIITDVSWTRRTMYWHAIHHQIGIKKTRKMQLWIRELFCLWVLKDLIENI